MPETQVSRVGDWPPAEMDKMCADNGEKMENWMCLFCGIGWRLTHSAAVAHRNLCRMVSRN